MVEGVVGTPRLYLNVSVASKVGRYVKAISRRTATQIRWMDTNIRMGDNAFSAALDQENGEEQISFPM